LQSVALHILAGVCIYQYALVPGENLISRCWCSGLQQRGSCMPVLAPLSTLDRKLCIEILFKFSFSKCVLALSCSVLLLCSRLCWLWHLGRCVCVQFYLLRYVFLLWLTASPSSPVTPAVPQLPGICGHIGCAICIVGMCNMQYSCIL